jgi:hexosaminidase
MRKFIKSGGSTLAAVLLSLIPCSVPAAGTNDPGLIPLPEKITWTDESFAVGPGTRIYADGPSRPAANLLARQLRVSTGYGLKVSSRSRGGVVQNGIVLTTREADANFGKEGYDLSVGSNSVVIRAPQPAGVFYGSQTLLELLPPQAFASQTVPGVDWRIAGARIEDRPRFAWRGLMLDVSRHFYTKEEVKRLLEVMAWHKLNVFHWHLVDDQGWRLEIKKYPLLTQVGAWRSGVGFGLPTNSATAFGPDGRYGGYYTQTDIREIVAFAAERHILIVPEIEMPGHSTAALAAYPQFSCFGGPYSTDIGPGVQAGVYCAGKDQAFQFLQDVLTEVFALFPGQYVHIGGDEVRKDNWKRCPLCLERIRTEGLKNENELQSYFVQRIEKFVNSRGKTLIGWSEIREGGLAKSAVVMDWIGGGLEAASEGHDVVMSPTKYSYFDHYQSKDHGAEPKAIGGYLPLSEVYEFEPIPEGLNPEFAPHILGGQANLWTEYIANFPHVEYMLFPRLSAMSEVVWSPKATRDWDGFSRRLQTQYLRYDAAGVKYRRYPLAPSEPN